ncbi:MAG: SDR family NAD(P)-dependent oxidoreductase [Thermoanaerobacterales bacterium]|jgi:benzil reductase ((S)-benzoin forming)
MARTVEAGAGGPGPEVAGRVAVVTGASRGLGAGLAARFAEAGLALGLCARHEPPVPDGAAERAVTAAVDVTDPDAVDRFADAVVERLGRIDLWVNNAGLLAPIGPLRDVDPGELRANIEVNVLGVLHGSATFARHVRSRPGGGTLVNITSGAATRAYAGWAAYCAAKAAVDHATRVVALEEADSGLRAFAVAPGVVDTDMQALIRATPPERFPSVDRFHRIREEGAYNSPAWVADHVLGLLDAPPDAPVVQRVPDEPR